MNKILLICFLLTIFFLNFLPVKDTDFGWHYRCGNETITQSKLCVSNTFTYFLKDYKAYNPSFLYDILLAFTYNNAGLIGVSLVGALIMTLGAYIFLQITEGTLWLKIPVFYVIFFLSQVVFNLGFRSQIITYVFFLLSLWFIQKIQTGKRNYFYFFPLLLLVWVNTHIGFFTGFIILGLYAIEQLWRKKYVKEILITGVLSFFSTLLNPFGWRVYEEVFHHSTTKLKTMIAEWVSPETPHLILIWGGLFVLFYILSKEKPFSIYKLLLGIFFAGLALTARRNVPFFYTIFFYILLQSSWIKSFEKKISQKLRLEDFVLPLSLIMLLLSAFIQLPETVRFNTNWTTFCTEGLQKYPCQAIHHSQLSGNVFSMYEWGGFIEWQRPDISVFFDGRMPAWKDENGENPYPVFLRIIQAKNGWNEKLRSLKTNQIFIANGTYLDLELQKNALTYKWKEIYRDDTAVIYQDIK